MASKKDDYLLGRNVLSRVRLNLQHFMFTKLLGYVLHPGIVVQEGAQIADIGTGSGIWMIDLRSTLPAHIRDTVQYHGFDINVAQAPPKAWLPSNFQISTLNINDPVPVELLGKFDIINLRLFVIVVRNNDPSGILAKLHSMLKPGGWLQWTEADADLERYLTFVSARPSSEKPGEAMRALHEKAMTNDPRFNPSWPETLANSFAEAGFEKVSEDIKDTRDDLPWLAFANDTNTMVYGELVQGMEEGSEIKAECEELYASALRETWDGTAWGCRRINVIGRKKVE